MYILDDCDVPSKRMEDIARITNLGYAYNRKRTMNKFKRVGSYVLTAVVFFAAGAASYGFLHLHL